MWVAVMRSVLVAGSLNQGCPDEGLLLLSYLRVVMHRFWVHESAVSGDL